MVPFVSICIVFKGIERYVSQWLVIVKSLQTGENYLKDQTTLNPHNYDPSDLFRRFLSGEG